VAWQGSSENPQPIMWRPVTVDEVDVVGNTAQQVPARLRDGFRLISQRSIDGYVVARFARTSPLRATTQAIADLAPKLLGPSGNGGKVIVQDPVSAS
jgi:hypothetical protein